MSFTGNENFLRRISAGVSFVVPLIKIVKVDVLDNCAAPLELIFNVGVPVEVSIVKY